MPSGKQSVARALEFVRKRSGDSFRVFLKQAQVSSEKIPIVDGFFLVVRTKLILILFSVKGVFRARFGLCNFGDPL